MAKLPDMQVPDFIESLFGPVHHLSDRMEPCPGCGDGSTHHFLSHGMEGRDDMITHSLVFEHRTPAKLGFVFKVTAYIEPVFGEDAWGRRLPGWTVAADGWKVQPCPPWPLSMEIVQWPPMDPAPRPPEATDSFTRVGDWVELVFWELEGWEPGEYGDPGRPGRWRQRPKIRHKPEPAPKRDAWLAVYWEDYHVRSQWFDQRIYALDWLAAEREMELLSPIGTIRADATVGSWFREG